MRDANRLKEKIQVQLDRRQVTSISLGALLLVGTVFAIGVMVGKKLGAQAPPALPQGSVLDRLDAIRADAGASAADGLTFQEELTRRTPSVERMVVAPRPAVTRMDAAPIAARGSPSFDAGGRDGADAGIATMGEPRPSELPAISAAATFFTVQVKSTQSQPEAEKFAERLRLKGYHPLVSEAEVNGKGRWYRVRVGRFDNRSQADRYLGDFERETHLTAFVTAAGH